MTFDDIKTPYELLEFMKNNIKYGFLVKNGKKYLGICQRNRN